MSVAKAPPEREPAPARTLDLLRALRSGLVAWLPLAVAGQILAWTAYAVTGAFSPWSWVKIGLLDTIAVSRVGFDVRTAPPSGLRQALPDLFGPSSVRVTFALGAGTLVAVVVLFRAGRDAVRKATNASWRSDAGRAALLGASVAPGFAVPMGIAALLVTLRFPQADVMSFRPVVWQAFVFPFALAVVTGGLGGVAAIRRRLTARSRGARLVVAAASGAWHGLTWAILLALLGTLVIAAVRPAASSAYGRWLDERDAGGAVVAMYHALVLPNQSVGVLAIAMGSCVEMKAAGETSRLCLDGLDAGDGVTRLLTGGRAELPFGPGYLTLLLVPAVAAIAGGRRAAEGVRSMRVRATRAAWAGAGFGILTGIAAWAASITITAEGESIASLGPDPVETAALALVWGIVGAAIGARLPDRRGAPEEHPIRGPGPGSQDPEGLPSETSLK